MFRSVSEIIEQLRGTTKRPYLVGIDGRSGAGKSILADRIHQQLTDAVVVRNDDFYRVMDESARSRLDAEEGYDRYFDWKRLEQQLLLPLTAGQSARYQRYDWARHELAETIEVESRNIVIVEGVYSTRPELRNYYDLRIWVETSDAERMRRQIAREENTGEWIQRWAAAETFYVDKFQPSQSADIIVAGQ